MWIPDLDLVNPDFKKKFLSFSKWEAVNWAWPQRIFSILKELQETIKF